MSKTSYLLTLQKNLETFHIDNQPTHHQFGMHMNVGCDTCEQWTNAIRDWVLTSRRVARHDLDLLLKAVKSAGVEKLVEFHLGKLSRNKTELRAQVCMKAARRIYDCAP